MEGRTQLIIGGVEVVLPQNFATTVKRENSFFTKNGEYTYDCTLRLDNQTNRELYGFLQRLNKKEAVQSKRSAVLMADGRVYCRGTEVITGWTDEEVTVQVVAGNSELNYVVSDSLRIEWLDMGEIGDMGETDVAWPMRTGLTQHLTYPAIHYCLPTVFNSSDSTFYNNYLCRGKYGEARPKIIVGRDDANYVNDGRGDLEVVAQPFLCALVKRLLGALGYTIGTNHLDESQYKSLFVVNTRSTTKYAEMLSGWTVKDFLEEVEKLTGMVLLVDNVTKTVDIVSKGIFYSQSRIVPLKNVVDAYDLSVEEEGEEDWTTSDVSYELPDDADHRLMRLPEKLKQNTPIVEDDWPFSGHMFGNPYSRRELKQDITTRRLFCLKPLVADKDFLETTDVSVMRGAEGIFPSIDAQKWDASVPSDFSSSWTVFHLLYMAVGDSMAPPTMYGKNRFEVDQFADLKRENSVGELKMKIRPAVMRLMPSHLFYSTLRGYSILMFGLTNIVVTPGSSNNTKKIEEPDTCSTEEQEENFIDIIGGYQEESEASAGDLLVAFYAGLQEHRHGYLPQAHTDAWHAQNVEEFWHTKENSFPSIETDAFVGSLRLQDIEAELYAGVYRIDTTRKVVFETYDPNMLDPRAIIVVRNRRWVVREIEETLTSNGRKPSWKVTCHPIEISDESAESRWVLTKGVWDDGGAWLDDGRWND